MGKHLATHGIGLIGALIFIWLDFPLPWLFGPLCSCLIAAVFGAQLTTVKIINEVIVVLLPILLTSVWQVTLDQTPGKPVHSFALNQLLVLGFCAIVGWKIAAYFNMFGATILGPLLLTAFASITGILQTRPPAEAIWAAQYFIALGIGVKYVGISIEEIRKDILAGLGFCVFLLLLSLVIVSFIVLYDRAPAIEAVLSLMPGGQAELVVMALIVGA
ncbi:MAG: AbrB family transcriptional regulator, partial [Rhodobacteraceae bacterium]|nr:AbrB family transcriptional regulator [Paracoccaceae bacterium]